MKDDVNGTGHNSSCYLNIMRSINKTKDILIHKYKGDFSKINLDDFMEKKNFKSIKGNFKGTHVEEAFGNYFSKNVMFAAQVGSYKVVYHEGYQEKQKKAYIFGNDYSNT
jgi:hypothetical protein